MNCKEANQLDLVEYLCVLGYNASKIRGNDYWYCSPLRNEKDPSFKINRKKNVWYDHGIGKGGKLIDFVKQYYNCNTYDAIQKISFFHPQDISARAPFHPSLQDTLAIQGKEEPAIKIIAAKQPLTDLSLCRYVEQRKIEKEIAEKYLFEVQFTNGNIDKLFTAIGFKNNAGGYELRNEKFKGSSSPKYVSYIDNKAKSIAVFEGFFDFLSYQTIHKNEEQPLTSFLVLNSLSFFQRSLLLMEKHESIHLYLDQDEQGRMQTKMALKRSPAFKDESKLYTGYKDINDWLMNTNKLKETKTIKHSRGRHL